MKKKQLILDVCAVSKFILCNNVGEETNYVLTYDNGWPESIPNLFITEYYIKFGMLKFPMHLLVVNCEFNFFHFTNVELMKLGETLDKLLVLNITT